MPLKQIRSLLSLLILFLSAHVHADHTSGGELTYRKTSTPGIFEITLKLYSDCQSAAQICDTGSSCNGPCTRQVTISTLHPFNNNQTVYWTSIPVSLVSVQDMNPHTNLAACPSGKSLCSNQKCVQPGTLNFGLQCFTFVGLVNLNVLNIPTNHCTIVFSHEICCLSSSIDNGPAGSNLYLQCSFNRCVIDNYNNSSAQFKYEPITYLLPGIPTQQILGGYDEDGDSLSFEFAPTLSDYNTNAPTQAPFNFDSPMPWTGLKSGAFPNGIRCNPISGEIQFTNVNTGSFDFTGIITVAIKEWRNINGQYVIIGQIMRTWKQTVLSYTSLPPLGRSPISITSSHGNTLKEGTTSCFTIFSRLSSLSDTIRIQLDSFQMPVNSGVSVTNLNPNANYDSLRICWTPPANSARGIPYFLHASAIDNSCPLQYRTAISLQLKVVPRLSKATLTLDTSLCGIRLNYQKANNLIQIKWSKITLAKQPEDFTFSKGIDSFMQTSVSPLINRPSGKYLVKFEFSDSIEWFTQFDTVLLQPKLEMTATDTTFCKTAALVSSVNVLRGNRPYQFRWYYQLSDTGRASLNQVNQTDSFFTFPQKAGITHYVVQVRDKQGCRYYKQGKFEVGNVQGINIAPPTCHGGRNARLNITPVDSIQPNIFLFSLDSFTWRNQGVFDSLEAGNKRIFTYRPATGCRTDTTILINTPPPISTNSINTVNNACRYSSVGSFSTTAINGKAPYQYSLDSLQFKNSGSFTGLKGGSYSLYIKDANNCTSTIQNITIQNTSSLDVSTRNEKGISCIGRKDGSFDIVITGTSTPVRFALSDRQVFFTGFQVNNVAAGNHTLIANETMNPGCYDTVNVTIPNTSRLLVDTLFGPSLILKDSSVSFSARANTTNPIDYVWRIQKATIVSNDFNGNIVLRWSDTGRFNIESVVSRKSDNTCRDSIAMTVTVRLPDVSTSISEFNDPKTIKIYPNPVRNLLTIESEKTDNQDIEIYNMAGVKLIQQKLLSTQQVDLSNLPNGIYLIRIGLWSRTLLKE